MEQNFVAFPQLTVLFNRILYWRQQTCNKQGGAYSILFERHNLLEREAKLLISNTKELQYKIEVVQSKQRHTRGMIKIAREQQEADYNRRAANQARIGIRM